MDIDQCPPQFIKKLETPIVIKTASGFFNITHQGTIPKNGSPIPLVLDTTFGLYKFHDFFSGLLGHQTLELNNAIIDYKEKILNINGKVFDLYYEGDDEKETTVKDMDHLPELYNIKQMFNANNHLRLEHLNSEESKAVNNLVQKYKDVFYQKGDDLTFTNEIKHRIDTGLSGPIYSKTYRYPAIHSAEVEKQINEMLEQRIIKHSNSPYNAPIWVVPKKEDKEGKKEWRIVLDYRKLNQVTREDKYPIPRIDDILDKLGRSNYFSTLDLTKGFYQIEVDPDDREKTAFSTHNGHYEFIRMPFGLKNAPATFQRMMNNVLKEHINKICIIYMDDILIFSTSLQEHINSLEKIFKTLRKANLKVSLNKSDFLKKETDFLGHIVSKEGIKPDPRKIEGIKKQTIPRTVKEIQSFLGLSGFYRKFIPDYAKIAKPLTIRLKKDAVINVDDKDYKESFEKLKNILMSDMVLRYPDFSKKFALTTDASNYALGAVLSQEKGPIAFASRTLNKHEVNYSTIEKELLAIVWGVKQFRHYLYGQRFKLYTDHKPLIWLANLKEPNSKLIRWKIKLNEYEFDISHLQGKENKVADALSRIRETNVNQKHSKCQICGKINKDKKSENQHRLMHEGKTSCDLCGKTYATISALNKHLREIHSREDLTKNPRNPYSNKKTVSRKNILESIPLIEDDDQTVHSAEEDSLDLFKVTEKPFQSFKTQIILKKCNVNSVEESQVFSNKRIIYNYVELNSDLMAQILDRIFADKIVALHCEDTQDLIKIQNEFKIRKSNPNNIIEAEVFITGNIIQEKNYEEMLEIIAKHHRFENNHPGITKTYEDLKNLYYYPGLKREITKFINNCHICNFKHERRPIKLPFENTETPTGPFQIYHSDIWFINNNQMYVTMMDKFTKYAMIEEIHERTTLTLIKAFLKLFILMKKPEKIVLDNESGFKSSLFTDFLDKQNIQYHFTTPNRHTGNSDIERLHGSLNEQIRIFKIREHENDIAFNIDIPIQALSAYNNVTHSTTGKKPIDLHFANKISPKEIFHRMEEKKRKTIDYLNRNRLDVDINPQYTKNISKDGKLEQKVRKINAKQSGPRKYRHKQNIYHKDQFIKKKKHISSSLDVLVGDFDYQPGPGPKTSDN